MQYLHGLEFDSVLEFGAGFGRITKLIVEEFKPSKYTAVDISQDQLYNMPDFDIDVQKIICDIYHYDDDNRYDLVIAVEVLMHQLPKKVKHIINNMIRLSKKHVVSLDYEGPPDEPLAAWNFSHDYTALYRYNLSMQPVGNNQYLYHRRVESK